MAVVKRFQTTIDSRSYFEGSFGDLRLDKIAAIFFFRMSVIFGVVLRKLANGEKSLEMAFNRLLKNPKFSQEALIKNVAGRTAKIINEKSSISHILCIQDTSEVVCDKKKSPTRNGFGLIRELRDTRRN